MNLRRSLTSNVDLGQLNAICGCGDNPQWAPESKSAQYSRVQSNMVIVCSVHHLLDRNFECVFAFEFSSLNALLYGSERGYHIHRRLLVAGRWVL